MKIILFSAAMGSLFLMLVYAIRNEISKEIFWATLSLYNYINYRHYDN